MAPEIPFYGRRQVLFAQGSLRNECKRLMNPGKIMLSWRKENALKPALHSQLLIYVPFEFDRMNLNKQQDGRLNVSYYDGFFGDSISWLTPQETKSIATWIQCFLRRKALPHSQLPVYIFTLKVDKCPLKKNSKIRRKKAPNYMS